MRKNTEPLDNKKRKKDTIQGTVIISIYLVVVSTLLLLARSYFGLHGVLGIIVLTIALLDLGALVPIWILVKFRLKEIEGGEEDAAAQY